MYWKTLMAAVAAPLILSAGAAVAAPAGANPPGAASARPASTEAEARARVEAAGYTNVENVQRGPDGWTANALHNGKPVVVKVNAAGHVSPAPPAQ